MNIFKHELRANLKPFIFWTIGLIFLLFAGITKYTGISSTSGLDVSSLMNQFPKVVLSVMGISGLDITTLGGYYGIISYYVLICVAIYGISLGVSAVSREAIDKTYEFIFTKPRTRSYILLMKLLSGLFYLTAFCVISYLLSIASIASIGAKDTITNQILLFSISVLIVGLIFFSFAAFISAMIKNSEKGSLYSNLLFLFTFVMGIIYDILDNAEYLKILAPMKYFSPNDLLANKFSTAYLAISIVLIALSIAGTFTFFKRKDLSAS